MAQVIPFPGVSMPRARTSKRKPAAAAPKVAKIGRWVSMPKVNRAEDLKTIALALAVKGFEDEAYALAQTEPGSKGHLHALHMTGLRTGIPRNNLRIFTTPEDVVQGIHAAWERVNLAHAEWHVADLRRLKACRCGDRDLETYLNAETEKAHGFMWLEYERLVRIPAPDFRLHGFKVKQDWSRGLSSLDWMRGAKPHLAAILDEEFERLTAEKAARKAARSKPTAQHIRSASS